MHLTPVPSSPQITLCIVVQLSKCYCCCWYWLCGSTVFFNPHSGSHHLELFTVWTGCKPIFCGEDLYVDCRFQKLSAVFSSVAVMIQQIGFGSLWIKKKIVKKMMHLWCMRCIWRNIRMEKYKNAVIFFTVESCFDIVELLYKWNCKKHLSVRYSSSCSFKTYVYEDGVNKAFVHLWQLLDSVFNGKET